MSKENITVASDFGKLFMPFPVAGFRIEDFITWQQKNYAAFTEATQLAAESWSTVFSRQTELARKAAEEGSNSVRQLLNGGAPHDKLAQQTELVKDTFEKGLANFREVSSLIAKANAEATDVLAKRVTDGLTEIKGAIRKA